jgi:Na+/melibiose symporter-like transporter
MPERSDGSGGITDRDGYYLYTLVAAVLIAVIMLVSALGTHKLIPYLDKAPNKHASFGEAVGVIRQTLSSHAFVIMAVSGMLYSIAIGLRHAAELYFYLFFWDFDQTQIALLTAVSVPSVFAGVALAPIAAKRLGKKKAALIALVGALILTSTPPLLRILELLPDNDDPLIFWIILVETMITQILSVVHAVLANSMLADVVEEAAVKTGQRSEGLILSAENLFKKMVSGLGTFAGGMLLALVHFPDDAKKLGVSAEVIWNFGAVYLPMFAVPFVGAIVFLSMFRIDRARHESNLAKLEAAAMTEDAVEEETGTR